MPPDVSDWPRALWPLSQLILDRLDALERSRLSMDCQLQGEPLRNLTIPDVELGCAVARLELARHLIHFGWPCGASSALNGLAAPTKPDL